MRQRGEYMTAVGGFVVWRCVCVRERVRERERKGEREEKREREGERKRGGRT